MDDTIGQGGGGAAPGEVKGLGGGLLGRIKEPFTRIPRKQLLIGTGVVGVVVALAVAAFALDLFGESSPPPQAAKGAPPAAKAAPARPAAAAPSKPAPAAAAEPPKEAPATSAAPLAEAPVAAPVPERAQRSRPATPRAAQPRVRREIPQLPARTVSAPPPEPKIYTPRYNDIMTAVLKPDPAGVTELLDLGRWVDKPDSSGFTPLHAAVRIRDRPMTELLLKRGASVNASAPDGLTALAIARANGDTAMISLLQRSGAQ